MAKATRAAFGEAILELGEKDRDLLVLDADLSKSTNTQKFSKKFPDRWFEVGIAEANMIGIGAGLALSGKKPFICSFACFLTGRFETIRISLAYNRANVKMVGTHCGIGIGEDGYTQMSIEDIACMRSLPEMSVVQPADEIETKLLIEYMLKHKGPVYIRLTRQALEDVHTPAYKFQFGKGDVLKEGKDIALLATGGVVYNTLKAAEKLEKLGVQATVVNIHTIKPLDKELIFNLSKKIEKFVTVEDHNIYGGLGGAVAEVLSEQTPRQLLRIGVNDVFAESGAPQDVYKKYGLDTDGIFSKIKKFLQK